VIVLQAIIIVLLAWVLVFYGKDEYEAAQSGNDDEISSPSRISQEQGMTVVTLSAAAQKASGMTTEALQSANFKAEQLSYGSVVNIEPLIDLRAKYLAALAEANVVRASITNSQQEFQRLQLLNKDDHNVSDRAVQQAEAALKSDRARLVAAETLAAGIRDSIRQQWGDTLASWAASESESALARLRTHQEVLVQVALQTEGLQPEHIARIMLTTAGAGIKPVEAVYVSPSPQTDATIQGRTYFFRAPAQELRSGMRVEARIQMQGQASAGVIVPTDAVVWYAGKAWAYRQQGERFTRLPVSVSQAYERGWFITAHFKEGDRVVTNGAQLLLSEELKYQIKNENDD
jgi:hypothetical protein